MEEKKSKKKFHPATIAIIGVLLMFAGGLLKGDLVEIIILFTGVVFPAKISTMFIIVGAVLFVLGVCLCVYVEKKRQAKSPNPDKYADYSNIYYRKKNSDFTSNRATAEFLEAHKNEDGTYSVEYEYEKENGESCVEQYNGNYSYIEAKYFQKVRRFTVAYGEDKSMIIDPPRPGIIPELAGMPVVSSTPIKAKKIEDQKTIKEEEVFKRIFCPYCDCMIKKNSNRCSHCGAPIRK